MPISETARLIFNEHVRGRTKMPEGREARSAAQDRRQAVREWSLRLALLFFGMGVAGAWPDSTMARWSGGVLFGLGLARMMFDVS